MDFEIQAYNIQIDYIKGKYNNLADYLSRQPVASISLRDDSNLRRRQNEPSFIRYVERHYPQAVKVEGLWVDDSDDRRLL